MNHIVVYSLEGSFFVQNYMRIISFIVIAICIMIEMKKLQDFAQQNSPPLFVNAANLPSFFDHNLLEPTRVVKIFQNDIQANIRVFYYQYLKLCFEADDCDYEQYINRIEEIINDENFSFVFDETEDPSVFNDLQFKQLIMEFFGLLGEGTLKIEQCLNRYPIMDTVFVYFLRSILILTNSTDSLHTYIDKMSLFNFLVSYFNIEINIHENCVRFPQTDIFVYQEEPEQVYMAYIEQADSNASLPVSKEYVSYQASQESIEPPPRPKAIEVNKQPAQVGNLIVPKSRQSQASKEGVTEIKDSYIESEFLDYTGVALHTLVKPTKLKQSTTLQNKQKAADPIASKVSEQVKKFQQHKPSYPQFNPTVPQYKSAQSDYQSSYSSKSQYNEMANQTDNILNTIKGKSPISYNQNIEQFSSKSQSSWEHKPKEPNSMLKTGPTLTIYQKQPQNNLAHLNYAPNNTYTANVTSNYGYSNKQKTSSINDTFVPSKVQVKKPSSYSPIMQNPQQVKKPPSFDPSSSKIQAPSSNGKNPCGLNVSSEFTNSFTMKLMNEPHRSEVSGIRQRARNYRNSLKHVIK